MNDTAGRGRNATFVHLAGQEFPALFVVNEPIRIDGLPSLNRFFTNPEGTYFVAAPEYGLDRSAGGTCAGAANLDGDADDEIFFCATEAAGGQAVGARIYDFDGTKFVDRTKAWGITPMSDRDIEVADFNGDGKPDIAQLRGGLVRVSLGTGSGFHKVFDLPTGKALAMAVGDINDDNRPDIYVARQASSNSAHLMLVNDGGGRSFTNVPIPQAGRGSTDDVLALDYDNNGLTDFLTINGRYTPGPIKLTAFFETN